MLFGLALLWSVFRLGAALVYFCRFPGPSVVSVLGLAQFWYVFPLGAALGGWGSSGPKAGGLWPKEAFLAQGWESEMYLVTPRAAARDPK